MLKWRVGGCLSPRKYTTEALLAEISRISWDRLADFPSGEEKDLHEKTQRFICLSEDFPDI